MWLPNYQLPEPASAVCIWSKSTAKWSLATASTCLSTRVSESGCSCVCSCVCVSMSGNGTVTTRWRTDSIISLLIPPAHYALRSSAQKTHARKHLRTECERINVVGERDSRMDQLNYACVDDWVDDDDNDDGATTTKRSTVRSFAIWKYTYAAIRSHSRYENTHTHTPREFDLVNFVHSYNNVHVRTHAAN